MWKKATAPLDRSPFSRPGSLREYLPPFHQQLDGEAAAAAAHELRETITAAVQDAPAAMLLGPRRHRMGEPVVALFLKPATSVSPSAADPH